MLHNIVKLAQRYVDSVNRRKNADLDPDNFTLVMQLTSSDEAGLPVLVTNTIHVVDGRPVEYSERLSTMEGMTLSFIVGRTEDGPEKTGKPQPKPVQKEQTDPGLEERNKSELAVAEDIAKIMNGSEEQPEPEIQHEPGQKKKVKSNKKA